MKTSVYLGLLLVVSVSRAFAQPVFDEEIRQALREVMPSVTEALRAVNKDSARTVGLLPPGADLVNAPTASPAAEYLMGLIKSAASTAGLSMIEPVDRSVWNNAVATIEMHERKGGEQAGILDPAYLNAFGKLKLAQRLLTVDLIDAASDGRRVMVEFAVHLYDLETNEHVWGEVFVRRNYLPENVQGLVALTPEAREVLRQALARAAESIAASPRVKELSSVAVIPLSGDIDRYVTQLARDAMTKAGLTPREASLRTEAEARTMLLNTPQVADAALIGALRDLSIEQLPGELTRERYKISAEVQLALLRAGTLDVIWSDTLSVEQEFEKELPKVEVQVWEVLKQNPIYLLYALGGLVVLIVFGKIIKAGQRVR